MAVAMSKIPTAVLIRIRVTTSVPPKNTIINATSKVTMLTINMGMSLYLDKQSKRATNLQMKSDVGRLIKDEMLAIQSTGYPKSYL